ncbi:ABC transporter substrate-binding protein [Beijerinckia sp. L45]|uniref:ABC transporter substrate-binding protein n=1 Tax=Beijerinckia sp. L45 TaxID=1641855 RepID=UPI00131BBD04|nr:ABC transporter substrate-binding protein [Beijerinckia sp. L45]
MDYRLFRKVSASTASLVPAILTLFGGPIHVARGQALQPWRHAIVEEKGDAGIVLMAGEPAIASRHGLNIDYVPLKVDSLALKALLAGQVDSFEGSPGGAIIAASRGADLKVLGCYWPTLSYGIFTAKTVTSLEQLKGKAFSIASPGSLPDLVTRAVLQENGISANEVGFAATGGDTDRFRFLETGMVGAAALSTEFVPAAAQHGLKLLVDGRTQLPNYLRLCTYVTGAGLKRRHDATVAFLASQMDGVRYAQLHREETIALTRRALNVDPSDPRPSYVYDEAIKDNLLDPTMQSPAAKLEWMQNLLKTTGNLTDSFDIHEMLDASIRIEAQKQTFIK